MHIFSDGDNQTFKEATSLSDLEIATCLLIKNKVYMPVYLLYKYILEL